MFSRVIVYILALSSVPSPAFAVTKPSMNMGSAFLQTIWALLIVIGIIMVIFALARKRFGIGRIGEGKINLLELRHIMPKTTLALVQVEGKLLLLGIGAGNISLLADVSDGNPLKKTTQKADFETLLTREKDK